MSSKRRIKNFTLEKGYFYKGPFVLFYKTSVYIRCHSKYAPCKTNLNPSWKAQVQTAAVSSVLSMNTVH